jgi:hypothetical protein
MIDALETGFRAGRKVMALSGPGGLGKTMVLRVLEQRLAGQARALHLPYAALSTEDLVAWVLGLLGHESAIEGPEAALREFAAAGPPLVLLLDDASALPPETARDLVSWARSFEGALRLVIVPVDDDRAGRVLAALGDDVLDIRLREPMSEVECRRYIAGRLDQLADPGDVLALLSEDRMAWLFRESAGNPRVLHGLATWLLYSGKHAPGSFMPDLDHWLDTDGERAGSAELEPEPELAQELTPSKPLAQSNSAPSGAPSGYTRRRRRRRG